MQDKMKSLITNIKLDAATFHGETVDPTYINFFFGKNGAGKSTVAYAFEHPECLEWQNGVNPADYTILIYNQEFIDRNLANYGDLKGVFTLSEENAETRKQIDDKTEERKGVVADGKQAAEDRDKKSSELSRYAIRLKPLVGMKPRISERASIRRRVVRKRSSSLQTRFYPESIQLSNTKRKISRNYTISPMIQRHGGTHCSKSLASWKVNMIFPVQAILAKK